MGIVHPWQRRRHVTREMLRSWPVIALSNLHPFRDLCSSHFGSVERLACEHQETHPWICPSLSTRTRRAAFTLGGRTTISSKPWPPAHKSKALPKPSTVGYCPCPENHSPVVNDNRGDLAEWKKDSQYYKVDVWGMQYWTLLRPPDKPRDFCGQNKGDSLGIQCVCVCVTI